MNKISLLLIEDNIGDILLLENYLTEQFDALSITQATNYKQTKDILTNEHFRFDVILLDLSLPDKSGSALMDEVLKHCKGAPVIVLTGYSDMSFGIKSLGMGISDYIQKDELSAALLFRSISYSLERKKTTDALRDSQQQYSQLFQFSPQPMWVLETETLRFLDVNEAAIIQYGFTREEFLSLEATQLNSEFWPSVEDGRSITATNNCLREVVHHKKKDGNSIHVETHTSIIIYKGATAIMVLATDVSEKLAYVKAIETQNKQLKEISWIQSHIVRAPLARIMGLVGLLEDLNEPNGEIINYLSKSAQELDQVIKTITKKIDRKDFYKRQYGQLLNPKN